MTSASPEPSSSAVCGSLDRHQQWRQQGIPTLSVLGGSVEATLRHGQDWSTARRRAIVQFAVPTLEDAVGRWTAALARERDLTADAAAFLASQLGLAVDETRTILAARTAFDVQRLFENVTPASTQAETLAVCRWLLLETAAGRAVETDALAGQLDTVLADRPGPWTRVASALAGLVPAETLPALAFAPSDLDALAAVARVLTALVTRVTALPVALCVEPALLARYQQTTPESQAAALLRAGLIPLPALDRAATLDPADSPAALPSNARRAAPHWPPRTPAEDDAARSAAERLLYERLEALPATAGLFELNGALAFRFGPKPAEVDLLARPLRLAVELDGYFHFQEADAYRRDRRKDYELQRRGFLVLRFLSADVFARLDEVLTAILAAVAHLRAGGHSPEET